MRDGVVLRADVFLPDVRVPVPALVLRTPYDRTHPLIPPSGIDPERAAEAGFALVCQDVRGQYGSDGEFATFVPEGRDGYDTVEWVAAQPWSNGRVGMVGRSYAAACQWLAAAQTPPHLEAIAPALTGSDYFDGWIYQGGAFQLGLNLFWTRMMSDPRNATKRDALYSHVPLKTVPLPDPKWARFYFEWLDHPTDDDFWRALSPNRRYSRVAVAALNVAGWFDTFLGGTLENFARMRAEGGSEAARTGQRLVVGPWAHGSTYGSYPDHSFEGFRSDDPFDLDALQLEFFSRQLGGDGGRDEAPVRIFVMGENRWRDEQEWPLARARFERWYLREGGRLSPEPPAVEDPDTYEYDPHNAAPTIGGPTMLPPKMMRMNAGPLDQRSLEQRADVLVYTSAPLERPLEVTGPLTVVLHASSSARDTDFVTKLTDVDPAGVSRLLAEGILRARFRDGFDRPRQLEPGAVYELALDLVATSNVFSAGHRIRIVVTSSSFPRFDRNANTGNTTGTDAEEDFAAARQTIFHDAAHASHVVLPIVPA